MWSNPRDETGILQKMFTRKLLDTSRQYKEKEKNN